MVTQAYDDLFTLAQREPLWWDECRVPRFSPFSPGDVNNIYADEVALCEVACQECNRKFLVAEESDDSTAYDAALQYISACMLCDKTTSTISKEDFNKQVVENARTRSLSKRFENGWIITGGDPPFHGYWDDQAEDWDDSADGPSSEPSTRERLERQNHPSCSAGYCMNVTPIRVVEFWVRAQPGEWSRKPELERVF